MRKTRFARFNTFPLYYLRAWQRLCYHSYFFHELDHLVDFDAFRIDIDIFPVDHHEIPTLELGNLFFTFSARLLVSVTHVSGDSDGRLLVPVWIMT